MMVDKVLMVVGVLFVLALMLLALATFIFGLYW